jgi:hypothetical protein
MLSEEDIQNCVKIIHRGVYWYEKLSPETIRENSVSELALYIRCLAEITRGMQLWFETEENIKVISDAVFIDNANLTRAILKIAESFEKELSQENLELLDSLRESYVLPYPSRKKTIGDHRKEEYEFSNTFAITSKYLHQDEASIFSEITNEDGRLTKVSVLLLTIAGFWRMDFRHEVFLISEAHPNVLSAHIEQHSNFSFPHSDPNPNREEELSLAYLKGGLV